MINKHGNPGTTSQRHISRIQPTKISIWMSMLARLPGKSNFSQLDFGLCALLRWSQLYGRPNRQLRGKINSVAWVYLIHSSIQ